MEKNYNIKHLIFGLRTLYKEYLKELEVLKQFCEINNCNIEDYFFRINSITPQNDVYFVCTCIARLTKIGKVLNSIYKFISGGYSINVVSEHFTYLDGRVEPFCSKTDFPINISSSHMEEFISQLEKIVSSEHSNTKEFSFITGVSLKTQNHTGYIQINNASLRSFPSNNAPYLIYTAYKDKMIIKTDNFFGSEAITENTIERILSTPIDIEPLSPIHKQFIDKQNIDKKRINVEPIRALRRVELEIKEDGDTITLSKKKKC